MIQRRQTTPAVSIIIPLYNKGKYILRALDSVLAQTYQDFEIIVVDDGSTDNSSDVVSCYSDPRLRLICQTNAGTGAARNRGIRESTAPLLAFLDADDEWLPEFLEKSVQRLHAHPECALTITGQYRSKNTKRISWEPEFKRLGITEGVWRMPTTMETGSIKPTLDLFHWGAILCSRKALEWLGGFYAKERCTYGEDLYLSLQIALNYKVYWATEPLLWYHTEASELGVGRKTAYPPVPIITDPNPIRKNCPPEYKNLLERCLAFYALLTADRCIKAEDYATAKHILRCYPRTLTSIRYYTSLQRQLFLASSPGLRHWIHQARGFMPFF